MGKKATYLMLLLEMQQHRNYGIRKYKKCFHMICSSILFSDYSSHKLIHPMNQDYACTQHRNYGPKEKQEDYQHKNNNNIIREIMFDTTKFNLI